MRGVIIGLVLGTVSFAVCAETLATCGASKGTGYYAPKGLVKADEAGWTEESISGGSFQLIRSGDDWDIIFTDATGRTLSSRADGGSTSAIVTKDGDVVVQVVYSGNLETYIFWLSLKKPIVSFSQAKFATLLPKHSLMVAECRRGT